MQILEQSCAALHRRGNAPPARRRHPFEAMANGRNSFHCLSAIAHEWLRDLLGGAPALLSAEHGGVMPMDVVQC